jgi:cytoskeletal protein RodZ
LTPEVAVNPGGGAGWDEPPLDIQIPDDARELDRDVLAYHRELRAQRRRNRLRGLTGPVAGRGTLMPVLASILAVCLVAGAMLSVATFSPATTGDHTHPPTTVAASSQPATPKTSPAPATSAASSAPATSAASSAQATSAASSAQAGSAQATVQASGTGRAVRSASPSAAGTRSGAASGVTATTTATP